ncbi:MAG: MgtC/SapB family protein [Bacteroidales bacterium]|jgi:putative Mg2+ transporter-C (MgtC) family protein|nr:MgtC/SapB family protein [Bacteroidales bacterium]
MISWSEILIRLLLASLFGALIGLERERKNWTAGLRTHMMVCVASSLIMIVSSFGFSDILGTDHVELDPSRVAAQVVSGIGFIGAGTILFSRQGVVHGLTTAAGLWAVAAIGLATGGGLYFAAGTTTIIALFILWAIKPFERVFSRRFNKKSLKIITGNTKLLKNLLEDDELNIDTFSIDKSEEGMVFHITFDKPDLKILEALVNELKHDPTIKEIIWGEI